MTKEQKKTKDGMRIRRKRWRTGLVSTGRGDWRRRPIPRVIKKYRENRKRTRTEKERRQGISNIAEKDDEKTTTRKRQRDESRRTDIEDDGDIKNGR